MNKTEKQPETPQILEYSVISGLSSKLSEKLESLFVEGLKLKGFEFNNKAELHEFVKNNCRCEDHQDVKEKIYFVNDTPFFLYRYETKMDLNPVSIDRSVKMSASWGSYAYL